MEDRYGAGAGSGVRETGGGVGRGPFQEGLGREMKQENGCWMLPSLPLIAGHKAGILEAGERVTEGVVVQTSLTRPLGTG